MREPRELKIGVTVVKNLAQIREDAETGIHPGDRQGPPAPFTYVDREEHKRFFDKLMAAVR